jgi:hypothetical protein
LQIRIVRRKEEADKAPLMYKVHIGATAETEIRGSSIRGRNGRTLVRKP